MATSGITVQPVSSVSVSCSAASKAALRDAAIWSTAAS